MKVIDYVDDSGYRRRSLLRDGDSELNAHKGIPVAPPDLNSLDWDAIKRDLHNELFILGLFTYNDLQGTGNNLSSAIISAFKSKLVALYREDL